jgi:hypothetical protein
LVQQHVEVRRTGLPPDLKLFWAGMVLLTAISVAYTSFMSHVFHSRQPWGFEFLWGEDVHWDFNVFRDRFLLFRTPGFWALRSYPFTYPAAAGVVFGLLYKLAHPLRDYLWFLSVIVCAWMAWLVRRLHAQGISPLTAALFAATTIITCWPLWLLFDTGNIEGVVVFVLALGLLAFVARRWWTAAILIGLAGALKLFPIILLALFLSQRRYKQFVAGLVVAGAVTLGSLALLGPSIAEAQRQINIAFAFLARLNMLSPNPGALHADHSLFTVVRYGVLLAHHKHLHTSIYALPPEQAAEQKRNEAMLEGPLKAYLVLAALSGTALYFLRIRKLPVLNQMLALSICAVLLPPTSLDYTLLHLLVPFGLLCAFAVRQWRRSIATHGLTLCFIGFAFLFTAGTYYTVRYPLTPVARCFTLLFLLAVLLRYALRWDELDALPPSAAL